MPTACPSCAQPMQAPDFERGLGGKVTLDLCFACEAIWFDCNESMQLAPGGVIELFKLLHVHRDDPRRPLSSLLACPRCSTRLAFTHDIARGNAITYYRCDLCHGRLTAFVQFLREKQFVRDITAIELAGIRAHVEQVRCSGCGAAINLHTDSACPYCRAPISILDADAVSQTLQSLAAAEHQRMTVVDPQRYAAALTETMLTVRQSQLDTAAANSWAVADLIGSGIGALLSLADL